MRINARIGAAVAVALAAGTLAAPAPASANAQVNNDPNFVQVYVNNIENLENPGENDCPGDWEDLIFYMKSVETPDLFLVQQLAGPGQLNTLLDKMNNRLPGEYRGVLAVPDPEDQGTRCPGEKERQTNAIIWRVGRFNFVEGSKITWQSFAKNGNPECGLNNQDRSINVAAQLWDRIAERWVSVASIHWPTGNAGGPACASQNAARTVEKVESIRGGLHIWGGDANVVSNADGEWRAWFEATNGQLGGRHNYKDVAYADCAKRNDTIGIRECLRDSHWTLGGDNRIDFLFAKRGDGTMPPIGAAHTVTFDEADAAADRIEGSDHRGLHYSDHRAIRARVHY
ncbi:MAG TPA: hypothetical protein VF062_05805 [Candidatus Limnocylindrales bacterium]